jgi:hypothetical protein
VCAIVGYFVWGLEVAGRLVEGWRRGGSWVRGWIEVASGGGIVWSCDMYVCMYVCVQVMSTLNRMVLLSDINSILLDDKREPEAAKLHTSLNSEIGIAHVQVFIRLCV